MLSTSIGTTAQIIAMIAWTLGLAVVWSELVQDPMIERLRRGKKDKPLLVPGPAGRSLRLRTKAESSRFDRRWCVVTHRRVTPGHGQVSADFSRPAMVPKQEIP